MVVGDDEDMIPMHTTTVEEWRGGGGLARASKSSWRSKPYQVRIPRWRPKVISSPSHLKVYE